MNKIFVIGRTEFLQTVRSKGFLIGLFLMPVLMGGSIFFQFLVKDKVDLEPRRAVVVDATGKLFDSLTARLEERNESGIWSQEEGQERKQIKPRFELEELDSDDVKTLLLGGPEAAASRDRVALELSDRVRDGELQGFFMIGADVIDQGAPAEEAGTEDSLERSIRRRVAYYTDEPTYRELPDTVSGALNARTQELRFAEGFEDGALARIQRLSTPVSLTGFGLINKAKDGSIEGGKRENKLRTFMVPLGALMLLFMLVMTSAPQLMNNVLEEKMQRISEVLVSAVTPFQLLMGKLLGGVFITLTLAATYMGGLVWASYKYNFEDLIPLELYGWMVLMIIFALFMYGALFSALGAACSELRDAQSMMMPAMALVLIPMFAFSVILENPNGSVAQILTFVPTSTPMILLFRLAAQPGPETWEIVVGLLDCVLTTWALVWGSAKIFRVGILSQGQAPSFRKLIGWLREG